ncbi:MAG: hypothetical protein HOP17_02190 [Acidobacteria bacterium]|nr:hypothetical protein [Acidobacteriota bacterium]
MKRAKLTNKDLDSLGRLVVRAGAADESEIERIASNPRLYEGVLSRIVTGVETSDEPVRPMWKPVFASAGVLFAMAILTIGYFKSDGNAVVSIPRALPITYKVEEAKEPFKIAQPLPEPEAGEPRPVPAVLTRAPERTVEMRSRPQRGKPVPPREADFHAIGFTANAEDAVLDGRVVRVEMPRSALFALGVDLPLENGTKSVKADLLVGSDGTPRGIRLVE